MRFKSFKQYLALTEAENDKKVAAFAFGRMNPPTIGHEKLMDALKKANPSDYRMYITKTQDKKKNPLTFKGKLKYSMLAMPKHKQAFQDGKFNTIFDVLMGLSNDGVTDVIMVAGSDRVKSFEAMLNKYNGVEAKHGMYNFNSIKIVSAGERDPDSDGVDGVSASKVREFAAADDLEGFTTGMTSSLKPKQIADMMSDVRKGMQVG